MLWVATTIWEDEYEVEVWWGFLQNKTTRGRLLKESMQMGHNIRRHERHVTPPLDEFIDKNEDEETKDLDHASINQHDRFWWLRNQKDERFH